jgi:hypothetical protein
MTPQRFSHCRSSRFRGRLALVVLVMAAALGAGGCNVFYDLEAVDLQRQGPLDAAGDVVDTADSSPGDTSPLDAGTDSSSDVRDDASADVGDDGGDANTGGPSCVADMGENRGYCAPADSNSCESFEHCTLAPRDENSDGEVDFFYTVCSARSAAGDLPEGTSCAGATGDCEAENFCVVWDDADPRQTVCSKLCRLSDGAGCGSDQFCTNPWDDQLDAFGFCTKSCDPYNPTECGSGQVCTPDFNYPQESCEPNFRCLVSSDPSGGSASAGTPCSRSQLFRAGCPDGMICAPSPDSPSDDICMQLCQSDADCTGDGACGPADPIWGVRYCTL